ncbi:hypothetical protein Y032_0133g1785 [Ancylostoma ceylanicum]|uniref:Uncharacterized protein n=1 Tax=Ancylostoma ceylanicum TaxID=53326 RepID=A0A016T6D4_9BILA|nr:hypothetical protein Y032_0133g1785 [Ancylostoma ceylanicum]
MEVDEMQPENEVIKENAALVQPDWDLALKEMPRPQFFVGVRKHGEKSVFANVEKEGDDYICADSSFRISVQQSCVGTVSFVDILLIRTPYSSSHLLLIRHSCRQCQKFVICTNTSGSLIVSNVMNGSLLRDLKGHIMDVYKCRFFPSGLVVLSAGMDMSVKVWSVETGQCPRTFKGHTMAATDLAIIGVGREVLSCSNDGTIIKWLCADGSEQERWRPEAGPCNAMSIDRKSELFAVACEGKKCVVYSVEGPTKATIATDNVPTAVCIDHELDNIVYIGDEEGMVSVYDTKLKSYIYRLRTNRGAVMKMMTRDEGLFVAFKDGSMCCYLRQCPPQSNISCPLYEFTGSDCDPIYDFCFNMKHLFTASRDRMVRKYRIP